MLKILNSAELNLTKSTIYLLLDWNIQESYIIIKKYIYYFGDQDFLEYNIIKCHFLLLLFCVVMLVALLKFQ